MRDGSGGEDAAPWDRLAEVHSPFVGAGPSNLEYDMQTRTTSPWILGLMAATVIGAPSASMAADANVSCSLKFSMSGWSVFYKTYSGTGTVTCSNGESRGVTLKSEGGGLTVGKSCIEDGIGQFSAVKGIAETMGSYASAEAHAGAVKSAKGEVLTKGEVSLALGGKGRGWDLGIAFSKFTISPN